MRCCEAWKPIGNLFEPISSECNDFQRLSQIIANLTRESLAERDAEITNLPWTQTEKDNALARCRSGQCAWRAKKPVLCLNAVTDEDGHPLDKRRCIRKKALRVLGSIFQAPDDIRWFLDRTEFDELIALKQDSAPGPDGIPYGAFWCAGGLGSQFLFNAF